MRWIDDALFLILWGGLVFVAVRALGARFFGQRTTAAAALAAVAFAVGGRTPFALGFGQAAAPVATVAPDATPAPPRPTPHMQALAACSPSIRVQPEGHGSVDAAKVMVGMDLVDRGGAPQLTASDTLILDGWAANDAMDGPAPAVCAVVDGKMITGADVRYGSDRGDVAAVFKHRSLVPTGYEVRIPPGLIAPGEHRLGIAVVSADRSHASVIPGTRSITIR